MYNFTNEAGELLIDAAALRFEDSLDEQSARERYDEEFYAGAYDEPDDCDPANDWCVNDDDDCQTCADYWLDFHAYGAMEDAWLDGSYEE